MTGDNPLTSTTDKSAIFILGTPRSGTTLTAHILGALSDIFMPGETHFFEDIYSRRAELGDPCTPEACYSIKARLATMYGRFNEAPDQERIERLIASGAFDTALEQTQSYRDMFDSFMAMQAQSVGKRRWGNQVPRDVFAIDVILEMFPDATIVACVRDPRDFMLSYRDNWTNWDGKEAARLRSIYHPVQTALLWKASMRALIRAEQKYPERIFINKYEDLVENSDAHMRQMCEFIGEPFDPAILDTKFSNSSAGPVEEKGISRSSIGRWKNKLAPEDAHIAQVICKSEMLRFGYQLAPISYNGARLLALLISTPFRMVKALSQNASVRGPTIPYLYRRLKGLIGR